MKRTPLAGALFACALLAPTLAAQQVVDDPLGRLTRRLQDVDAHIVELRRVAQQHATGADVGNQRWLQVSDVDRSRAEAAGEDAAAATLARTDALRDELARVEHELAAARDAAETRALGDSLPRPEELARLASRARGESPPAGGRDAVDMRSPATRLGMPPARARGDGTVVIHGTVDGMRIGSVLLEAGIDLLATADRLAGEGRVEAADATRVRARERLEAARNELEPLARDANASLAVLFALARTEEKLGRIAVADALYATIIERDKLPAIAGREPELGSFGRSATTARSVMAWVRDTGAWRPRRDVDKIRWDRLDGIGR